MELAQTSAPYHNKALPAGSLLREWRLESVLGVGGFGIVYRAKGVYFDETVAIKEYFPGAISDRCDGTTVTPTDSSSEQVYALGLEKFVEEAKVLWNLSRPERHPNIVSVRSLFEMHGTAYMVMDFEEGVSLSEVLRQGRRFDEAALLAWLRPLAKGLARAHAVGVLHRDIKPANILIRDTGAPVLIDFGSARFESGQATSTNVSFYTPPYAALEQHVRTYAQGPWTDIYALGVVLYQCVTGEKPAEVLERLHGGDGQPLSEGRWPGFSRVFTRAVDAAMAIRPAERPQSVPEWLELFERPDGARNEELTRVRATLAGADLTRIQTLAASAPARAIDRDETIAARKSRSRRPSGRQLLLGGAGALVVSGLVLATGLIWTQLERPATPTPTRPAAVARLAQRPSAASPPVATPAPPPAVTPILVRSIPATAVPRGLESALADFAAQANQVRAPAAVLASASAARAKVAADSAEIRALAATPESAARGPRLLASIRDQVAMLAHGEIGSLSSDAEGREAQVERILGASAAAPTMAAYASLRRSGGVLAAVSQAAGDPVTVLASARRMLAAYGDFNRADGVASQLFVPARRQAFGAARSTADAAAKRVIAAADVAKPWFLASQSRKQAYQRLQANAAKAKALQSQLAQLSQSAAAATTVGALDADTLQVSGVSRALAALSGGTSAPPASAAATSGAAPDTGK